MKPRLLFYGIAIIASSASASVSSFASVDELIQHAAQYNGRRVSVSGYFDAQRDGGEIVFHAHRPRSPVLVLLSSRTAQRVCRSGLSGGYARVTGTLHCGTGTPRVVSLARAPGEREIIQIPQGPGGYRYWIADASEFTLMPRRARSHANASNQAMQLTAPRSVSPLSVATTFNLQPRALSGAVADLVSR